MSMTLSHLLSVGFFPDQLVIATERALRGLVGSVVSPAGPRAVADVAPAALLVFARSRLRAEDVRTDLAIRLAAQRSAAGIVLQRPPAPLPLATRSLAERSGLALVLVDHPEPDRLAPVMDRFLRIPEVADAGMLSVVAHRLRAAGHDSREMVRVVADTLRHPVALVDAQGRVVAGTLPEATLAGVLDHTARLGAGRPAPWVRAVPGTWDELLVAQPIQLTPTAPANLWLLARVPVSPAATARAAGQVLGVAAWAFVAYLAAGAVDLHQRDRRRSALLSRLLDEGEPPHRQVLEQATSAGWRLGGWHTAVHICTRRGSATVPPATLRELLREKLARQGFDGDVIAREDGWSFWASADARPSAAEVQTTVRSVRHALLSAEHDYPELRLCAGVGAADEGIAGLERSLREAGQAALLARGSHTAAAVELIGTGDAKRLLVNRYVTGMQNDLAEQLLSPLVVADPSGQLVHTLSCYLDHESAATATAAALGVHRNTVLQRLERIRALLSVDFADADERLALHLATRLVRPAPQEHPDHPRRRVAG